MPDYLSPGVYIEELPPALRAIEGVSTSTAGFVGAAGRGPVPGFALPFTPASSDPQVVTLVPTPTPLLVTSFANFTRQFGDPLPLPDPSNSNYLAYAVRGFFDNGGQRAYISRVVHSDSANAAQSASYGSLRLSQGSVLRLAADAAASATSLTFTALRGIAVSAAPNLSFFHKNGTPVMSGANPLTAAVRSYNSQSATGTLTAAIGVALAASDVYAVIGTSNPNPANPQGPTFWARNPGAWSGQISISVTPSRRRTVAISAAATAVATEIQVASTAGFYQGAIVEVDNGTQQTYVVVASVRAGGLLELTAPLGVAVAASTSTARIVEIDISIVDPSPAVPVTETYTQLTWNPDPSVRQDHYSTVINAQSGLVYVQPPGVGGATGSESATLASQPITFNGWPFSAASGGAAVATLSSALNTLSQAAQALGGAVTAMAGGALPAVGALPTAVTNAATALSAAATAAAGVAGAGPAAFGTAVNTAVTAANSAVNAANDAVTQATTAPQTAATGAALATDVTNVGTEVTALRAAIQTATSAATGGVQTGNDGNPPGPDDYVGQDLGPGFRSGIQALKDAESISIIAAPGQTDPVVQGELINQCELLRYRFAVLDGEQNPAGGSVNAILTHRDQYDSSYAAYYVPWLQITLSNQNVFLPPSGHIAGVYAGTDNSRGVWKAPANVVVQNITGLKTYIVKGEQDILNPAGVDCIRRFDQLGTRVWGARTISSDSSLMYVNVRRTLIFLEASIDYGTQWVVFEPNNPDTWGRVTDSVTAFLMTQWTNGALFGVKPSDAFFVRCDLTTMTADDIQNGRLICLIGVAIVRPAEFVIFRIEQITGLPTTQ
jgi:phage tail sheath protein FI